MELSNVFFDLAPKYIATLLGEKSCPRYLSGNSGLKACFESETAKREEAIRSAIVDKQRGLHNLSTLLNHMPDEAMKMNEKPSLADLTLRFSSNLLYVRRFLPSGIEMPAEVKKLVTDIVKLIHEKELAIKERSFELAAGLRDIDKLIRLMISDKLNSLPVPAVMYLGGMERFGQMPRTYL